MSTGCFAQSYHGQSVCASDFVSVSRAGPVQATFFISEGHRHVAGKPLANVILGSARQCAKLKTDFSLVQGVVRLFRKCFLSGWVNLLRPYGRSSPGWRRQLPECCRSCINKGSMEAQPDTCLAQRAMHVTIPWNAQGPLDNFLSVACTSGLA